MYCKNCGRNAFEGDNFCANCGGSLRANSTASGDSSANIAGNNSFSNSPVYVGTIYQGTKPEETAYIDRTYIKPLKLADNPVKVSWLRISGAVGFVGSCASIFSVVGSSWQSTLAFIVTSVISIFLLTNGIALKRTRFSRLKWFNLEANKKGEVFLTKIGGNCPKCDGLLKLVDIEVEKDRYKTFVRCSRIDEHIWLFDPSALD